MNNQIVDSGNILDMKAIKDLKGYKFFIPSYQRGYRWSNQQIQDLLMDIYEFSLKAKENDIYCLQPVIVKPLSESEWEVIDGQQRLTTIYIVLNYIKKNVLPKSVLPFTLSYETRKDSETFLINIDNNKKFDNIDYFHMVSAVEYIQQWFETQEDETSVAIKIYDKLMNSTQIIWYQINDNSNSIDIFTRINVGKIPLTNAELIKALFLNKDNFKSENEQKIYSRQYEIANEWDRIEALLQNDNFWLFICNGENNYDTRIDFIFDLLANKKNSELNSPIKDKGNNYYSFLVFSRLFKETEEKAKAKGNSIETVLDEVWLMVRRYYKIFEEWYQNRTLYHLIGYLISIGYSVETIKNDVNNLRKTETVLYLKNKIAKDIEKIGDISQLTYTDNRGIVRKILLLFNVISLENNSNSNTKFPFELYKKEQWDIEHIHAISSKIPNSPKLRSDWLDIIRKETDSESIKKEISDFLSNNMINDNEEFEKLYTKIILLYGDNLDIDDISNLTLLDSQTNRSYKNSIFPIKRKTILEKDRSATFIPLCTKNVFLKYYSRNIDNMSFWGADDRVDYLNNIKETLKEYLPGGEEVDE